MSVIIKGMKMPHSCMGCRFCEHGSINEWDLYCGIDNKHVGNWDDKHINNGWRRPDCPLVEVPPHGRLVDADWIREALNNTLDALKKNPKMEQQEIHLIAAFSTLGKMLEDAPTIIEAEEGAEE